MAMARTLGITTSLAMLLTLSLFIHTLMFSPSRAFAHEEIAASGESPATINPDQLRDFSVRVANGAGALLALLTVITLAVKPQEEAVKTTLFSLMVLAAAGPTIYFAVSTVYLNMASETKGPVHWHADFQIFACGQELSPPTPKGFLSNKVGTPILHEHVDRRIHVEGVVVHKSEVSLARFFEMQGGVLAEHSFTVPTEEGLITYENGDRCPNGTTGAWQTFLYTTEGKLVTQRKLSPYTEYVLSPEKNVPPGDCIILEFGPEKSRTDALCPFYQISVQKGDLQLR